MDLSVELVLDSRMAQVTDFPTWHGVVRPPLDLTSPHHPPVEVTTMSSFWLDQSTDTRYYPGRAFVYGDMQYTKKGATPETFTSLGFVEVSIQQRPDDRYYYVSGPDDAGAYNAAPRPLEEIQKAFLAETNSTLRSILSQTDYLVLDAFEAGEEAASLPQPIRDYRSSVRACASQRIVMVGGCDCTEDVEALVKTPAEIYTEGRAAIENPEPHLPPWPQWADT